MDLDIKNKESQINSIEGAFADIPDFLVGRLSIEEWRSLNEQQRMILSDLDKLPEQLTGTVPESVWETLNLSQKLQFLFSREILPRTLTIDTNQQELIDISSSSVNEQSPLHSSEVGKGSVESSELKKEFEGLRQEVDQMEKEHESVSEALEVPTVTAEDLARINTERGSTFSQNPLPQLAGYQPDDNLLVSTDQFAMGDPKIARTWSANIVKKFWNSLNQ